MNRRQNLYRPPFPPCRRGFTLIELMVTIGIIVILVSILFVAIAHVERSAKTNATHATLGNLKGLMSELDSTTQLQSDFPGWLYHDGGGLRVYYTTIAGSTFDFWRQPFTGIINFPTIAPGDVTAGNPDRDGSVAILNTSLAMNALGRVSANRTAMNNFGADRKFFPAATGAKCIGPGSDKWIGTTDDMDTSASTPVEKLTENITYPTGCSVQSGGIIYTYSPSAGFGAITTGPPGTGWVTGTPALPLLLDGWNNPIIFVPATGLQVRLLNGQSTFNPADATQTWIIVSPEGRVTGNGTANPTVTTPGRPFWASAGPDGDFSKGDDNVYSFEQ
ncbi:MAG TPA: prepilin-type N-terminal cleavage/methylation domain-containing protein [Tepidisphaeraceae bacterium]|jgi:prepilin-type N-terminal cleavage/methylation domain-containing protein|nr:prepilin-type N-terminal cleavage/methylation domain-containing protein [Tepidisphaeraceae bacterium]